MKYLDFYMKEIPFFLTQSYLLIQILYKKFEILDFCIYLYRFNK